MSLHLDYCSHEAAKYAVARWHYSKALPAGKLVKIGVWEDGSFRGAIVFGDGVLGSSHSAYGVSKMQIAELVRIALRSHKATVSRMVSIAIRLLRPRDTMAAFIKHQTLCILGIQNRLQLTL